LDRYNLYTKWNVKPQVFQARMIEFIWERPAWIVTSDFNYSFVLKPVC